MPHLGNCTHLLRTKSAEFDSLSGSCCHAAAVSDAPRRISTLLHVEKLLNSCSDHGPTMWLKKKKKKKTLSRKNSSCCSTLTFSHVFCICLSAKPHRSKWTSNKKAKDKKHHCLLVALIFKERQHIRFPFHSCNEQLAFQFKTPSSTDTIAHLI